MIYLSVSTVPLHLPIHAPARNLQEKEVFTMITTETLAPLLEGIIANIGIIIPVGISVFAIMLAIAKVPKIFLMMAMEAQSRDLYDEDGEGWYDA